MSRTGVRPLAGRLLTRPEASIVIVTVLAVVYFAATTEHFADSDNLTTLIPFFAPFAILAVGLVLVMACGEIDLSIGSVFLFAPLMVHVFDAAGVPLVLALVLALGCCAVVGLINGVFTELLGVSSFITTLGMLLGLGGLTLIISDAAPIPMPGAEITTRTIDVAHVINGVAVTVPERVNHIGTFASVFGGGALSELIWALAIVALVQVVLTLTRWGRYTIAVGGNRMAARELGIDVRLVVVRNFVVCSVLAGFVGVMEAVRTSTITPDTAAASETMFRALSAAVIGGTLLAGGTATAIGALFGALFLGILRDGLTLDGVDAQYLDLILGIAILGAMVVGVRVSKLRTGRDPGDGGRA